MLILQAGTVCLTLCIFSLQTESAYGAPSENNLQITNDDHVKLKQSMDVNGLWQNYGCKDNPEPEKPFAKLNLCLWTLINQLILRILQDYSTTPLPERLIMKKESGGFEDQIRKYAETFMPALATDKEKLQHVFEQVNEYIFMPLIKYLDQFPLQSASEQQQAHFSSLREDIANILKKYIKGSVNPAVPVIGTSFQKNLPTIISYIARYAPDMIENLGLLNRVLYSIKKNAFKEIPNHVIDITALPTIKYNKIVSQIVNIIKPHSKNHEREIRLPYFIHNFQNFKPFIMRYFSKHLPDLFADKPKLNSVLKQIEQVFEANVPEDTKPDKKNGLEKTVLLKFVELYYPEYFADRQFMDELVQNYDHQPKSKGETNGLATGHSNVALMQFFATFYPKLSVNKEYVEQFGDNYRPRRRTNVDSTDAESQTAPEEVLEYVVQEQRNSSTHSYSVYNGDGMQTNVDQTGLEQVTAESVPTATLVPETEFIAQAEFVPEAEVNPQPEFVPEAEVNPQVEFVPEIEVNPQVEFVTEIGVNPQLEIVPEIGVNPQPEFVPETEVNPQTEFVAEIEVNPQTEFVPEIEVNPQLEIIPETEVNPQPELVPETEVNPQPEFVPEAEVNPQPEFAPEIEVNPQAEFVTEIGVNPQPEFVPEAEVNPQPEFVPEIEVNPQLEIVPETEVNPQPEFVPEIEVNPQPEFVTEIEVNPQPELNPEPALIPVPSRRIVTAEFSIDATADPLMNVDIGTESTVVYADAAESAQNPAPFDELTESKIVSKNGTPDATPTKRMSLASQLRRFASEHMQKDGKVTRPEIVVSNGTVKNPEEVVIEIGSTPETKNNKVMLIRGNGGVLLAVANAQRNPNSVINVQVSDNTKWRSNKQSDHVFILYHNDKDEPVKMVSQAQPEEESTEDNPSTETVSIEQQNAEHLLENSEVTEHLPESDEVHNPEIVVSNRMVKQPEEQQVIEVNITPRSKHVRRTVETVRIVEGEDLKPDAKPVVRIRITDNSRRRSNKQDAIQVPDNIHVASNNEHAGSVKMAAQDQPAEDNKEHTSTKETVSIEQQIRRFNEEHLRKNTEATEHQRPEDKVIEVDITPEDVQTKSTVEKILVVGGDNGDAATDLNPEGHAVVDVQVTSNGARRFGRKNRKQLSKTIHFEPNIAFVNDASNNVAGHGQAEHDQQEYIRTLENRLRNKEFLKQPNIEMPNVKRNGRPIRVENILRPTSANIRNEQDHEHFTGVHHKKFRPHRYSPDVNFLPLTIQTYGPLYEKKQNGESLTKKERKKMRIIEKMFSSNPVFRELYQKKFGNKGDLGTKAMLYNMYKAGAKKNGDHFIHIDTMKNRKIPKWDNTLYQQANFGQFGDESDGSDPELNTDKADSKKNGDHFIHIDTMKNRKIPKWDHSLYQQPNLGQFGDQSDESRPELNTDKTDSKQDGDLFVDIDTMKNIKIPKWNQSWYQQPNFGQFGGESDESVPEVNTDKTDTKKGGDHFIHIDAMKNIKMPRWNQSFGGQYFERVPKLNMDNADSKKRDLFIHIDAMKNSKMPRWNQSFGGQYFGRVPELNADKADSKKDGDHFLQIDPMNDIKIPNLDTSLHQQPNLGQFGGQYVGSIPELNMEKADSKKHGNHFIHVDGMKDIQIPKFDSSLHQQPKVGHFREEYVGSIPELSMDKADSKKNGDHFFKIDSMNDIQIPKFDNDLHQQPKVGHFRDQYVGSIPELNMVKADSKKDGDHFIQVDVMKDIKIPKFDNGLHQQPKVGHFREEYVGSIPELSMDKADLKKNGDHFFKIDSMNDIKIPKLDNSLHQQQNFGQFGGAYEVSAPELNMSEPVPSQIEVVENTNDKK